MRTRISYERIYNFVLGFNVLGWGIAGLFFSTDVQWNSVRIAIALINLTAGLLFIFRREALLSREFIDKPAWLLVLVANGFLFRLSLPLENWAVYLQVLFGIGTAITLFALLSLGQSFSIRPALREVIQKGLYQWVRHPAYLGEGLMGLACMLAGNWLYSIPVFCLMMLFQIIRLQQEENILKNAPEYQEYMQQTRWRLIPGIW